MKRRLIVQTRKKSDVCRITVKRWWFVVEFHGNEMSDSHIQRHYSIQELEIVDDRMKQGSEVVERTYKKVEREGSTKFALKVPS